MLHLRFGLGRKEALHRDGQPTEITPSRLISLSTLGFNPANFGNIPAEPLVLGMRERDSALHSADWKT